MSESAVAERYARAVFEIGTENGQLSVLTEQLHKFAEVYTSSRELRAVLSDPLVSVEQRDGIVVALVSRLALAGTTVNTLRLLARRGRLRVISKVSARLTTLSDEKNNVVRVKVTTAKALSDNYFASLSQQLSGSLGRRVMLERVVDPSLIAGVITQVGDNTFDGSVKGRLQHYEQTLLASE